MKYSWSKLDVTQIWNTLPKPMWLFIHTAYRQHVFFNHPYHLFVRFLKAYIPVDIPCDYNDVIMRAMASQITCLVIVYSTVYSVTDQRKHKKSVSLVFVRGAPRWPVNPPHKGPVTRNMFPFDDVIMLSSFVALINTYPSSKRRICCILYTFHSHPNWVTVYTIKAEGKYSVIPSLHTNVELTDWYQIFHPLCHFANKPIGPCCCKLCIHFIAWMDLFFSIFCRSHKRCLYNRQNAAQCLYNRCILINVN